MLSVILIAIFLAGILNIASVSSATAPQNSYVNMNIYLENGGSQIGFVNNPVVYVNSTTGSSSQSFVGSTLNVSLNFGSYIVTVMPTTSTSGSSVYYSSKQSFNIVVNSPIMNEIFNITGILAYHSVVQLSGLNGQYATIQFSTEGGYVFDQVTTNASSFKAYLPAVGNFFVNSYFSSPTNGELSQIVTLPTNDILALDLSTKSLNYFGSVYDGNTGQAVNGFNVIGYNSTVESYTTMTFSGNTFAISSPTGTTFVLAASGYAPVMISSLHTYKLTKSTSYVYTNYTLGKNLRNITITSHYSIMGTAFPGFNDSGVSYLQYQEAIVNTSATSNFSLQLKLFLTNNIPENSYMSFTVGSTYYSLNASTEKVSVSATKNGVLADVSATYHNGSINASSYKNMQLNIFMHGTSYTPASVMYESFVTYANTTESVSSASTQITYGNPFEIYPVSSSSTVVVKFGKIQNPYFTDSNIAVYYKGIKTTDSILNTSAKNAVIIAPNGQNFSLNISGAFFNPINGQYEYNTPGVSFSWDVNGVAYTGTGKDYNMTFNFTAPVTHVSVKGTSSSGFNNVTNITVLTVGSSYNPFLNLSYTQNGATHNLTALNRTLHVNQGQTITFDASKSSLNITYNKSKYSLNLYYSWSLPNYTASGSLINYKFTTPSISKGTQMMYLNITSSANTTLKSSLQVYVNDTTPPTPVITLQNQTHHNVSAILAGTPMYISANYTTSQYYSFSSLKFNWTFRYANGTVVSFPTTNLSIISYNTSHKNFTHSNWLLVEFNTLGSIHIDLNASNPNATAYSNQTYTPAYTGPQLLVSGVVYSGTFTQGTSKEISVNVTNQAKSVAKNITIVVYGGGSVIGTQTYTGVNLGKNVTKTFTVNVTFANAGSQNLSVQASTSGQPSFVQKDGQYTSTISVGASNLKIILVVVAIIVILVAFGLIYYRITQGRFPGIKPKMQSSTAVTKQKPQDQKQPEVQKTNKK